MSRKQPKRGAKVAKGLAAVALVIGAAALANALIFYRTPPLTAPPVGGENAYFPTPDGDLYYKKAGEGPRILLLHGIGAGCSSWEFRRVFAALSREFTVYALDLPGFGKSDKPAVDYSDATFINAIDAFAREVVGAGGQPIDVIASSLAGAYAVALVSRDPSRWGRLVLISPTGAEELIAPVTLWSSLVRGLLRVSVLGTGLYNLVASRVGIRSYLERFIYADPAQVDDAVVTHFHTAAHQPGGEHVLPSFVTGFLNADVRAAFARLDPAPLLVWGEQARQSPPSRAGAFLRANPATRLKTIPNAGMLPHEEQPDAFLAAALPFLRREE